MTEHPIRVAIAGATGRMGSTAVQAIANAQGLSIAGLLVHRANEGVLESLDRFGQVYVDPQTLIDTEHPDVWLDLTTPKSVVRHIDLAIAANIRPVVGATGYSDADIARWQAEAAKASLGGLICPNFAIGALLMMRFAKEAARWMERAEIIELHHAQKLDMPSGTSLRTRDAMGVDYDVPIHSVRLPGLVAHQEVIFGGVGETLTIRHDSLSRESFMPGVLLACRRVVELNQVLYGLEHLLW
ncbi:4-hydroxy-tetrahydrodipicolinate reductase [Alicyclobacillus hesperidum]|uniref:4-hydroxy-tetrahydrodipicolinate reductase n=2 Tax=Alicyclobacillus hesperidum TaxID=89784 RepID=A0A1H2WRP2_9BACL|nr:4-hydroxy-tetrahydrodipicolinate reductase [Alicyclobacillus hesperidum]SDW83168.1 dihydrodipicolinate reductase [Alicyclobacillus hesperidum]